MVGSEPCCSGEGGGFARRASASQADTDGFFLPPGRRVGGGRRVRDIQVQAVTLGPGFSPLSLGDSGDAGKQERQGFGSLRKPKSRGALPFSPAWTYFRGTLLLYQHGGLYQRTSGMGVGRGPEGALLGHGTAVTSGSCIPLGGVVELGRWDR